MIDFMIIRVLYRFLQACTKRVLQACTKRALQGLSRSVQNGFTFIGLLAQGSRWGFRGSGLKCLVPLKGSYKGYYKGTMIQGPE